MRYCAKKSPLARAFLYFNAASLDLRFLVKNVLAYRGIVLFGLHLFGMQTLVLGRRVKVTGTGT
jgi:hypothetical protein